jgi:hypothetical protein
MAASPTSVQAANANIAYGLIPGHKTSTADAVKAYVQAYLNSEHPTWISLPPELWPAAWKGKFKRPMVRLIKSLYGHPESGAHWERHLEDIIVKEFKGEPVDGHPSSYWIKGSKLLLTVYVDDLLLSGPEGAHKTFWDKLEKLVDIEEVTPLERFLGRHHEFAEIKGQRGVRYQMKSYAQQAVDMYVEISGCKKLRAATTPFCPDGSLTPHDDEEHGELADKACAVLMKLLWLGRLARPDLVRAISGLASKVQCWSKNNDKQLYRLICYLNSTLDFYLEGYIGDKASDLRLRLYADADFAGDSGDARSTSGGYLVVVGPNSFFPLSWVSRKQTSVSRSTTESEIVSLAFCVYSEALPMLNLWDLLVGGSCELEVLEDNEATIKIVRNGFSSKLRHVSRTHKVNIAGLKEVLTAPHVDFKYVGTKEQAADIFTKALGPQLWGPALDMLGITRAGG